MATGDAISQKVVEKRESLDPKRCARFFAMGCFYVGPILRVWYMRLDRLIPKTASMRAGRMMFVDQFMFTPVFVPGFLGVLAGMQGQSGEEIVDTVKKDYVSILLSNWMLWPAAQLINFDFVPLQLRVVFASGVALVWNIYLAWKSNQGPPPKALPAPQSNEIPISA